MGLLFGDILAVDVEDITIVYLGSCNIIDFVLLFEIFIFSNGKL